MIRVALGIVLGMALTAAAQTAPTVPDWVVKYAGILQQRVQKCEQDLAQESDKVDKLAKDLAASRAAEKK